MKTILLIAVLVLSGCAMNPGIVQVGKDEFMVSRTSYGDTWSSGGQVLAGLYVEAAEKCGDANKVEKVDEQSAPGAVFVRNANATLRFRCNN